MQDGTEAYLFYTINNYWALTTGKNFRLDNGHCWFYKRTPGFFLSHKKINSLIFILKAIKCDSEFDVRKLPSSYWYESIGDSSGFKSGATVKIS